jgi:hypothetical protein
MNAICGVIPVPMPKHKRAAARGVALIFTLLILALLMVLSLGMVIALSSQTFIGGYYRNFRGAFYAADSGVNIARQRMINKITSLVPGTLALGTQPLTTANATTVQTDVNSAYGSWTSTSAGQAAASWPGQFELSSSTPATFTPALVPCTPSFTPVGVPPAGGPYTCANPPPAASTCSAAASLLTNCYVINNFAYTYTYSVDVLGQVKGSEQSELSENGSVVVTVNISPPSGVTTTASFAAWGMFIDNYALCDGSSLVNGTISGPVFTNGSWNFNTGSYIFTDKVGQQGAQAGAAMSSCHPTASLPYTNSGQTVNPTFQNGFTPGMNHITPPGNSYNQRWAVLDGRGIVSTTPLNTDFITSNMRNPAQTLWPVGGAANGVYMPYSTLPVGSCSVAPCMTGGGIYVKGSATVTMSAVTVNISGTNHSQQVFTIVNNSTTTTVTVDLTSSKTTFAQQGGSSVTINGVPSNLNNLPPTEATMLYVDGAITSLAGTGTSSVQDHSAVTITANGDITITGNITYATKPVTTTQNQIPGTPADTLIPGSDLGQVLGIFTANGNINLHVPTSGQNLEIDASIAAISSGGTGGIINNGNSINTLNIVGGRIQSDIYNIGSTTRNVYFDRRFAANNFAPPWFPSTSITTVPAGVETATAIAPAISRVQWVCKSCQ